LIWSLEEKNGFAKDIKLIKANIAVISAFRFIISLLSCFIYLINPNVVPNFAFATFKVSMLLFYP
jgi:hypothetical protein